MRGVLVQIDPRDPVSGAVVPLLMASVDDPAVCHLGDKTWWPVLTKLPTLSYDLFSGAFDGKVATQPSNLAFSVAPWAAAPALRFAGARAQIWTGDVGAPFASWTRRFDGRATGQPGIDGLIASATIAVDDAWIDTPVLGTYAGTGDAEGGADLKGTVKPLALGAPRYAGGVLVDSINSVFQISGAGPIFAVDAAFDRLSRFPASVGDFATHAALIAAAIPPGRFATCIAEGKVRLGAPPAGVVSFIVRGDVGGYAAGFPRKPGELIRRIALLVGGAGRIDDASLDALDAGRPMPLSIMVTDQTTARDLIQRIAQSVNAVAGVSWLGKLFVARIGAAGDVAALLRADGTALPPVGNVEQVEAGTPWWRLDIEAQRSWTVHSLADVAFTTALTERGRYKAATTYREGDIVDLADGSRWLYVSVTPGTSAPPAASWSALTPALKADGIVYESGATLQDKEPAVAGADKTADTPTGAAVDAGLNDDGTVKDGKVTTPAIAAGGVTGLSSYSFPDQAVGNAEVTLAEVAGLTIGDGVDGRALAIVSFTQDGSTVVDTSQRIRIYVDTGNGYIMVRDRVQGIQVSNGNARWILSQSIPVSIMASGPVSLKVTAQGNSLGGGPTSGSSARDIQVDIFRGSR